MFNVIDWVIIAILGISVLFGFLSGFMRSVLSVLVWVAAVLVSMYVGPALSSTFAMITDSPDIQLWLSYIVVFIVSAVVGWVLKLLLGGLLIGSGRNIFGLDGLLGGVFGLVRGGLLVILLIWFAMLAGATQTPLFQQASLMPIFMPLTNAVVSLFPNASAAVQSTMSGISSGSQSLMNSAGSGISSAGSAVGSTGSGASGAVGGAMGGLGDQVGTVVSAAKSLAGQVGEAVQGNLGGGK